MQAQLDIRTLEELLDDSYQALEREELKKARNLHRKACQHDPKDRDVRILEIDLLEAEDSLEEAAAACDALAEDFPEDPIVLFRLATSLLEAYDDTENATLILEELVKDIEQKKENEKEMNEDDELELMSFLFEIYLTLVNCYHTLNKPNEALKTAQLSLDIFPDDPIAQIGMATSHFEARDFETALDYLNQLLESHAHFADAHFMRARVHLAMGNEEEAENEFARANAMSAEDFPVIKYYSAEKFKGWCEECLVRLPDNLGRVADSMDVKIIDLPTSGLKVSPSAFTHLDNRSPKSQKLYIFQKNLEISSEDERELKAALKDAIIAEISEDDDED